MMADPMSDFAVSAKLRFALCNAFRADSGLIFVDVGAETDNDDDEDEDETSSKEESSICVVRAPIFLI